MAISKEKHFGVQKQVLKLKSKQEYLALRKLYHLSKNMYNVGLYSVRQHFFKTKEYLNYHLCKQNENYQLMGSAAAQQTLKKVEENFKSFFGLQKMKERKANIPRYIAKDGFFELSYPQFKLQEDGTFNIPTSPTFKKEFGMINIQFPINLHAENINEIRIIPKYNAHYFEIEYVYEIEVKKRRLSENEALSIDLGIDNFAACIDTLGNAFIIDSKRIKSVNRWYNKENARLDSIKNKQKVTQLTSRQIRILQKRNHILHDYLNKTVSHMIQHCLEHGISKIVVGHNEGWKNKSNMGKRANQRFVQIPHSLWMKKMESMCERYGIVFMKQEESYTSKASFLDDVPLPVFTATNHKGLIFSGKRIYRGLYQTKSNRLINADINGAANILRKCTHTSALAGKVVRGLLAVPVRIRLT
ncbi:RNA-guided endonuclease InsQ/TnpB family protein [Oceanobacillus jeddahense]|uniref:RNA-guided endonuclease InsQ/TnpB family protein n=1 Tax=Oceanobacillus jeddahense TaxID=1462527 RepID=UPI000B052E9B|nr:transposase [Oceanobacillus jeddahense]